MKAVIVLVVLGITLSLVFAQNSAGWRGIVPLQTTRSQVEQLLGPMNVRCNCYSTPNETVHVEYATSPCKGYLAGWNVPTDTVLSLQIYPKDRILFSELKISKEEFVKTVDDATFSHYANGQKGLRYSVASEGILESIWYGPSVTANHLRCAGFPPTDGGVTTYRPFDEFPYETAEEIKSRLGEFGVRLTKKPEFKGYVIVYGTPDKRTEPIPNLISAVKTYLIDELNVDSRALELFAGGCREMPTVAVFLIPREWPPPVSTPTLGRCSIK